MSKDLDESVKRLYRAGEDYEEAFVQLFCNAYKDARGVWPHPKLEEALREAVRGNV